MQAQLDKLNTTPPASVLYSHEHGASALRVTHVFLDCSTSGPTWFASSIRNKKFNYPLTHNAEFVPVCGRKEYKVLSVSIGALPFLLHVMPEPQTARQRVSRLSRA